MIIMHTTCHREFGGLEKRIYNESCKMAEKGHSIIIAAPDNSPLIKRCRHKGFRCIPMEFTSRSAFKDYFALKSIYRELKPDVLNTHGNTDAKIALLAAWEITTIKSEKGVTADGSVTNKKRLHCIIPCTILSRHISADVKPSWYNKILYNSLSHYVFTTADYTTDHLISTLDIIPDRIFTLPSGIAPPEELPERNLARATLASELNINEDSRFIGFVGRVSEDKGVEIIIKAFLLLADSQVSVSSSRDSLLIAGKPLKYHLVIVGKGDIKFIDELKQMVKQSQYGNNIHFTGFKENTWPYYRAFDCTILASKEVEGISQSLLEAMYARCPVAGSKIGGTCDIIKDGKTGLLFKPGQIENIATSILQILNDKYATENRIEQAFRMVKEKFTIDSMINRILNIYDNQVS